MSKDSKKTKLSTEKKPLDANIVNVTPNTSTKIYSLSDPYMGSIAGLAEVMSPLGRSEKINEERTESPPIDLPNDDSPSDEFEATAKGGGSSGKRTPRGTTTVLKQFGLTPEIAKHLDDAAKAQGLSTSRFLNENLEEMLTSIAVNMPPKPNTKTKPLSDLPMDSMAGLAEVMSPLGRSNPVGDTQTAPPNGDLSEEGRTSDKFVATAKVGVNSGKRTPRGTETELKQFGLIPEIAKALDDAAIVHGLSTSRFLNENLMGMLESVMVNQERIASPTINLPKGDGASGEFKATANTEGNRRKRTPRGTETDLKQFGLIPEIAKALDNAAIAQNISTSRFLNENLMKMLKSVNPPAQIAQTKHLPDHDID